MRERLKKAVTWVRDHGKVAVASASAAVVTAFTTLPTLASTTSPGVVDADDFANVTTAITNQVSVTTIVGVIASIAATCIGLVFLWWAIRKVVRMIMSAFKKGRLAV